MNFIEWLWMYIFLIITTVFSWMLYRLLRNQISATKDEILKELKEKNKNKE